MNEIELVWAAGFFDGEGSVYSYNHKSHGYEYMTVKLAVGQSGGTEELERFQKAVGRGRVNGPYTLSMPNRKLAYKFDVGSFDDILHVARLLWPYLCSVKKKQFKQAIMADRRFSNGSRKATWLHSECGTNQ